jgi:cytochrome c biogenesis protein CcmG, thiol:disulfide interchange protein DsbE
MKQNVSLRYILALCLSAVFGGPACAGITGGGHAGNATAGETVGAVVVGKPLPDFQVQTVDGKRRRLSDFHGKVLLVDVWASWCAPCKVELPMLDDMARRLKSRGVEILAVSVDQEKANMMDFIHKQRNWSVTFFHDPDGRVPDLLQPPKMPTSYVVDRMGVVRMINQGFETSDARRLEDKLEALASGG